MRLIDADKLYPDCLDKTGRLAISQSQIANAPTVPLPDFKEGYKQAIRDGKTNFSRPQGEWVIDKEHTKNPLLWYKCNLCCVYHSPTNYCPNCGADMKGGIKNDS